MPIETSTDGGEEIEFEAEGVGFVLRVFPDPSGLRGQVFRGEEKVAGVQIYHSDDRDALLREARRDRAVLRAAARPDPDLTSARLSPTSRR